MARAKSFIRFAREMLGPWGLFWSVLFVFITAAVGIFGTEKQQQQQNSVAQLLTIAPWYAWAIAGLTTALLFVLARGYLIVDARTRGLQLFETRGDLAKAHGTFDYELSNVERAWMMAPVATTLQAGSAAALGKIDRAIFADIQDTDFAPYTEMICAGSKIFRANLYQISLQLQESGKEVRWHRHPPLGVLIANPKSDEGWARIELLMPYVDAADRMSLKIYRKERPELFGRIVKMFEDCWSNSREPNWATLPDLYPQSRLSASGTSVPVVPSA